MKRKTPFNSSVKNKFSSASTQLVEENLLDDEPPNKIVECNSDEQSKQKKVEERRIIGNHVSRKQLIAAIDDFGSDRKQLDKETWRFNQFTPSEASIWDRLISKIKLNQTESIRHFV